MTTNDTPRVSFTVVEKQMTQIYIPERKRFLVFSTKLEQTAIPQSHIINPLLTSFAQSVGESIAFGFYRTDLVPSLLGLYKEPQAILFRTDLALG